MDGITIDDAKRIPKELRQFYDNYLMMSKSAFSYRILYTTTIKAINEVLSNSPDTYAVKDRIMAKARRMRDKLYSTMDVSEVQQLRSLVLEYGNETKTKTKTKRR